jgi:electron transport complex protein RnfG
MNPNQPNKVKESLINKEFLMPLFVLPLICLFISGALAIVNSYTKPVIENASSERAAQARKEIIPEADGFKLLETGSLSNGNSLPVTVTEVYSTTNNTGFIFIITTPGYGGNVVFICGIDPDGKIIKTQVLAQTETKGLGTPIFEKPYIDQYWGRDKNGIENIDAKSGATITSNAYKNGIRDAFAAFEIVRNHP